VPARISERTNHDHTRIDRTRNRTNAQHSTGPRTEEAKPPPPERPQTRTLRQTDPQNQGEIERYQAHLRSRALLQAEQPANFRTIEALVTAEFRRAQAFAAEQDVLVQLKLQVIDELEEGAPDPSDEELDGLARLNDAQTTKLLPQLNRHYNAADRAWHKH
jgi:hypothetical protein